ncbi:helix-turn-helix domain-containing protein [Microbacterium oxydans]|uniref:helix-turn-helix domain-containing protein n=1 Tax=Microbacterium oxydans TaxID=82380 RepID=UPI00366CA32F
MSTESNRVVAMGRRIAYYRKARGISAAELAERAGGGLTRSVIANLENGRKVDLSVQQLFAIAEVLNVPASSIVGAGDRLRAAFAGVDSTRAQYMTAMQQYLEALIDVAIEADRSTEIGPYEDLLDLYFEGKTPARMTMAMPMSKAIEDYIKQPSVAEGKYVKTLMETLDADMRRLTSS